MSISPQRSVSCRISSARKLFAFAAWCMLSSRLCRRVPPWLRRDMCPGKRSNASARGEKAIRSGSFGYVCGAISSEGCSNGCSQQKLRCRRYRLPPLAKGFPTLRPKQPGMCTNIPQLCIIRQVHSQRASLPLCKIQEVRAHSGMYNTMHVPAFA